MAGDGDGGADVGGERHRPNGRDPFARALDRLVAEATAAEAARERTQERTLRSVAEAEATFAGVAVDLAEQGRAVVVRTTGGRSHRGRIVAVGRDLVIVRDGDGAPVLISTHAVASLRPHVEATVHDLDTAGGRPAPLDLGLAVLLSQLAAERPQVQLGVAGDDPVTGVLRAAGADVVTVRLAGARRPLVHVRLGAVTDVVLLDL